jgi:hypothetical protein
MASVELTFVPPDDLNLDALLIYESDSKDGPFSLIETVDEIGIYPDWISEYTTTQAQNINDWFTIRWRDNKGAETRASVPVEGGAQLLVGRIVRRMRERDAEISMAVSKQEAEAAIQQYYGDKVDPYDPLLKPNYRITTGLVYLAMARVYAARTLQGDVESATIGLVSFKKSRSTATANADQLLKLANRELGLSMSVIMLIKEIAVAGNNKRVASVDLSRLMIEVQ